MKTSKVISTKMVDSFTTDNGQFFVHSIEFDNKDKGQYTSKSEHQNKFTPGQFTQYTIEEKQTKNGGKYFKVKPVQVGGNGGQRFNPMQQKLICYQSARKDAVALITAMIASDKLDLEKVKPSDLVKQYAKSFYNETFTITEVNI